MNAHRIQTSINAAHPASVRAAARHFNSPQYPPSSPSAIDQIVALGHVRIIAEGSAIHRAGDTFRSVYLLRSGAAKRLLIQEDGREQILGFPMPGELVGIEAIDSRVHTTTVMTLDLCAVVEIPFVELEELTRRDTTVAHFLMGTLSGALREEHGWLAALGLLNADERLAAFLLDLSQRFAARGFSSSRFVLRMTRAEIGSFLGLTLETVSRVFSRFQKLGLIAVTRRDIELLNLNALSALAQVRATKH